MKFKSISPSFLASVALHESGHWLVRSTDLLLVLTIRTFLSAKSALFTSVLVDLLLHILVKSCTESLHFLELNPLNILPCLLVEVNFLVIQRQLFWGDLTRKHASFRLPCTFFSQSSANGNDSLVHGVIIPIFEFEFDFLEQCMQKLDDIWVGHCLIKIGYKAFEKMLEDSLISWTFSISQGQRIFNDCVACFFDQLWLLFLLFLFFLCLLHFFQPSLHIDAQLVPLCVDQSLVSLCNFLMKLNDLICDIVELLPAKNLRLIDTGENRCDLFIGFSSPSRQDFNVLFDSILHFSHS